MELLVGDGVSQHHRRACPVSIFPSRSDDPLPSHTSRAPAPESENLAVDEAAAAGHRRPRHTGTFRSDLGSQEDIVNTSFEEFWMRNLSCVYFGGLYMGRCACIQIHVHAHVHVCVHLLGSNE